MITDQSSDLRAGVPAHQPEPGESSTRSCRFDGYLPPLRPHPILSLLSTPISILITSFVLFTSCTSPTPPPPPPPPAGPDTTSHEFIWQIDTLGDGNSSVLYDVAIINDTTIWAVGEIYLKDSTGRVDPDAYNLAKWSGGKWQMVRVPTATYGGFVSTAVLTTIWAFGRDNVWTFSIAGSYSRWNGNAWSTAFVPERSGSVTKLWGSSSSNLYAVGTNGSISHFDGTTWRRIESGTTTHFQDIWGDLRNDNFEVIAVASNGLELPADRRLYQVTPSGVALLPADGVSPMLQAIWFKAGIDYWVGGDGLYRSTGELKQWQNDSGGPAFYHFGVRGLGSNDIIAVGGYAGIAHYNGANWKTYTGRETPVFNDNFLSVAVSSHLVVAVGGYDGRKASVLRGRR